MKRISILEGLMAFVILLGGTVGMMLHAQSTKPNPISQSFQVFPQTLTGTSAVDLYTLAGGPPAGKDVYVCELDISTNGTATSVTIADKQASPVDFMNGVAIAANTTYSPVQISTADQACRWFPGGLTIKAANANALSFYISGKYWTGAPPF